MGEQEDFVGYVGDADLHEATVIGLKRQGPSAVVLVETSAGRRIAIGFDGVTDVKAVPDAQLRIHGLAEMSRGRQKRFVFVRADRDSTGQLEIVARKWMMSYFD
jgi:hypothetical protein